MSRAMYAGASGGGAGVALSDGGYFERSERPLTGLLFLLPLIVFYELGTRYLLRDPVHGTQHIVAFTLMRQFFGFFGATGRHLPALAVVGILLTWHIARKDPWEFNLRTMIGMAFESVLLAFPLIALSFALAHYMPQVLGWLCVTDHAPLPALAAGASGPAVTELVILSLGAGVYEELVFRLILLTFLWLVLRDVCNVPKGLAGLAVVVLTAVLFSAYHYLGPEQFDWPRFTFRTLAGIYFGALFLTRGFGITAASHAAYDILIILL